MKKFDSSLYFITDSTGFTEEEFLFRVEQALKGGATLLQLREKNKSTREYIQLAEKVHAIAKRYNVPLIIDDRIDVALAIDAEGVHVGAEDMPVATAWKLMGDDKLVVALEYPLGKGVCHSLRQSLRMGCPSQDHLWSGGALVLLDGYHIGKALQWVACCRLHTEYGASRVLDKLLDDTLLVVLVAVLQPCE